jgi:hypothetical protein
VQTGRKGINQAFAHLQLSLVDTQAAADPETRQHATFAFPLK